jgi:hypothetical protein
LQCLSPCAWTRVDFLSCARALCPVVTQYHNTVRRAVAARSTPEAMEVSDDCSPVFEQTVLRLLQLTRPLSFTML